MTTATNACEYHLDAEDYEGLDEDAGPFPDDNNGWTCPREAERGESRCVFHLPVESKRSEEVTDRFIEEITRPRTRDGESHRDGASPFLGARFEDFDLSGDDRPAVGPTVIDLSHAEFVGETDFGGLEFEGDTLLQGATFHGDADFSSCTFRGDFRAAATVFEDRVSFNSTTFEQRADFSGARFDSRAYFKESEFGDAADFVTATFDDWVSFRYSAFDGECDFKRCRFGNEGVAVCFEDIVFRGDTTFELATIEGEVGFTSSEFNGDASFEYATFEDRVYFDDVTFGDDYTFKGATFGQFHDHPKRPS